MNDSIPETTFDPGICIFTPQAFAALLAHCVPPGLVVDAHTSLLPGAMSAGQLYERLKAVICGQPVVSHFRLKGVLFGSGAADLVVTTDADRHTTVVTLASEN
jgi:hypothetical protein